MNNRLKGVTLIEVLIAAGVLALILGSTVALGRSVTRNQIITQDRAQALALTVEAVEIIRNLRDSTYIDKKQNKFNDFLSNTACSNQMCENLEISWDTTPNINNWIIDDNLTAVNPNPGEGGALPTNGETDNDPTAEVITVNISTGDISDNTSRVKINKFKDTNCSSTITGSLLYCRRITLMPTVYDNNDEYLPVATEENPKNSQDADFSFEALASSSFKVISKISWNEFGQMRTVESTDIITNWR